MLKLVHAFVRVADQPSVSSRVQQTSTSSSSHARAGLRDRRRSKRFKASRTLSREDRDKVLEVIEDAMSDDCAQHFREGTP